MALRTAAALYTLGSIFGLLAACSSSNEPNAPGTGGVASGTGGSAPASGGATPTSGGAGAGTGGTVATGGTAPITGGTQSATGGIATGGSLSTSGGTTSAGGTSGAATGGAGGGAKSTGGAGGAVSTGGAGGKSTGGAGPGGSSTGGSGGSSTGGAGGASAKFSFFVTSLAALRSVSGKDLGFGGDLRFGEATGLAGADKICTTIAEKAMPGAGAKGWRAFLSTSTVNAIERIGSGPWYDRMGRVVAPNVQGLLGTRPAADTTIVNDLPNETGAPNRSGTGTGMDDNHDTITGSNTMGKWDGGATCSDWTSATGSDGPRVGHSWPAASGQSWMQAHAAPGCEPSVSLVQTGAGSGNGIGNGGGYGGFYCFALMP
jgi:hypothetical protein